MAHVNVMDNVVRIRDGSRVAEVYLKELRGKVKPWCDLCDSESCLHVNFSWSLPEVRTVVEG